MLRRWLNKINVLLNSFFLFLILFGILFVSQWILIMLLQLFRNRLLNLRRRFWDLNNSLRFWKYGFCFLFSFLLFFLLLWLEMINLFIAISAHDYKPLITFLFCFLKSLLHECLQIIFVHSTHVAWSFWLGSSLWDEAFCFKIIFNILSKLNLFRFSLPYFFYWLYNSRLFWKCLPHFMSINDISERHTLWHFLCFYFVNVVSILDISKEINHIIYISSFFYF